MIVVRLDGGLGNQMFQYAFGRRLAHQHQTELKLDLVAFGDQQFSRRGHVVRHYDLDIFKLEPKFATEDEVFHLSKRLPFSLADRALNKIVGRKATYIVEPHFHFSYRMYSLPDNVYVAGYWQTERYFAEIESIVRADFTFKDEMSVAARSLQKEIEAADSVCLNVRRGDFVTNQFHGAYGVDYFSAADSVIRSHVADYRYFVFSDDIEWCQSNLRFDVPTTFVTHDHAGPKFQDYLRLMSSCRHFVIPNSSFAWWAVWFNQNPERIVIAPKRWFQDPTYDTSDLIPTDWIRI